MPFKEGCACHVWAIDGYSNDAEANIVNNLYADEATRLLLVGDVRGSKHDRVAHLVQHARRSKTLEGEKTIIYGGWRGQGNAAPEHMWLEYNGYIYDTMPGAPLRRVQATAQTRLQPPSEGAAFARGEVGQCESLLTVRQYEILKKAAWEDGEYMP